MAEGKKLQWGIISTANIAKKLCLAVKASETGELRAVGSRNLDKATAWAKEQGIPVAYGSYDELLADPEIDIVYNALPNHMHAEWSIKALRAGKHVLHEKPFATHVGQTMRVVEEARRAGKLLLEAYMFRAHPQTFKLIELIRSGVIGQVRVIHANFAFNMGQKLDNIRQQNHSAGGGIMDVGCYTMNGARVVAAAALGRDIAEPVSIQAVAHIGPESRVDEYASAVVKFDGDIVANLTCGTTVSTGQRMVVYGSKGSIEVPAPWLMAESATITVRVDGQDARDEVVTTSKHPYAFEVDACAEFLTVCDPPAPYLSWADSISLQRSIDSWREAVGLRFDEEDDEAALSRTVTGLPLARFEDAPMTTARVPGIDKDISRLVMGSMIYNPRRQAFCNAMLDYFYELGGNAIDTAHIYGGGQAEVAIGNWIRQRKIRQEIVLIAKGGCTEAVTPEMIERELTISLDRLQTDHCDLYMMHRDNTDVPVGEFVDCLNALKDAGKIRAFGGSNWTIPRLQATLEYAEKTGKTPFAASSPNYSLAVWNQAVWAGCTRANDPESRQWHIDRQFPLFAWSSQARGFFSGRYSPDDKSNMEVVNAWYNDDNWERLRRATELGKKKGVTAITIAAAFVLAQDFPIFALVGPATMEETRTSCDCFSVTLTPDELAWLNLES